MNAFVTVILRWINVAANAAGGVLLAPAAHLPGWLSIAILSAVTGVILLVIFKYTSNQRAIERVRNALKADMLSLKLFKDSFSVTLSAQGRLLLGAVKLLVCAIVPMLVSALPVALLLAQMGLYYQHRPLRVGEHAVVTMEVRGAIGSPFPEARLIRGDTFNVTTGPVRILSKREICWEVQATRDGAGPIGFEVDGERIEKQFAVGEGFMRLSKTRPGWNALDVLVHPAEEPFGPDSTVRSVDISYPERDGWFSGAAGWMIFFFAAAMVCSFAMKPVLKVKI